MPTEPADPAAERMEKWALLMLAQTDTKTPETHPDHQTIGRRFRAWDGRTYRCAWWNPRAGFQMESDDGGEKRITNVSERAIGATYHRIYDDE